MASLGDVSVQKVVSGPTSAHYLIPLDDRIHSFSDAVRWVACTTKVLFAGPNSRSKPSTPFTIHLPDAIAGQIYLLFKNGLPADIPRMAEGDGVRFYDLDDGVYYAGSTSGLSMWKITIVGTSVTIEALTPPPTSDGGTPSSIWFG